jgi:hypothetical protein
LRKLTYALPTVALRACPPAGREASVLFANRPIDADAAIACFIVIARRHESIVRRQPIDANAAIARLLVIARRHECIFHDQSVDADEAIYLFIFLHPALYLPIQLLLRCARRTRLWQARSHTCAFGNSSEQFARTTILYRHSRQRTRSPLRGRVPVIRYVLPILHPCGVNVHISIFALFALLSALCGANFSGPEERKGDAKHQKVNAAHRNLLKDQGF